MNTVSALVQDVQCDAPVPPTKSGASSFLQDVKSAGALLCGRAGWVGASVCM